MSLVNDLIKQKMTLRNRDPFRATTLGMIADEAKKIAKNEQREVTDADVLTAIQRMKKETIKAIDLIKKGNGDTSKYEQELPIYEEFLPKMKTHEETMAIIQSIHDSENLAFIKKNMGVFMKKLKEYPDIDPSVASQCLQILN